METLQWIISAGTNIFEAIRLNDDLSLLRTSLAKARLRIDPAERGSFKNKELAVLLSHLKDTTYDAEDLLREFDDQVLRKKIEDADRSRAGQLLSSSLNLAKSLIHGSKARVKETQSRLDRAVAEIEGALSLLRLNVEPVQLMPETSSVIGAPEVLGRDEERDLLIEMLGVTIGREDELDQVIELLGVPLTRGGRSAGASGKRAAAGTGVASTSRAKRLKGESSRARPAVVTETNCNENVSVLAIVGIGGVGKTTLAQFIYNDARVKAHFSVRIWVCVSDLFNKKRITKEIIKSVTRKDIDSSRSLDDLQVELIEQLEKQKRLKKKFLLVLDDIWPNANDEWEAFYAPLRHGFEGNMVLVTTRFQKVADLVTTIKPVELKGLPTDIFREFFKKCAFGKELPESYPQLQDIGQSIADRLCGSPLAAKTLGRLLNMELTERHWRTIQNSELWELPHQENEILPALQLSYLYLPQELKRCFAFCSVFPKDYSFERDVIVDIWVAQGFIAPGGNVRPEDMGSRYLDDLRSRFLFQTDPKFLEQSRYVMHDLIHDMAQSVSVDECFLMRDLNHQNQRRMPQTVRHISIEVNNDAFGRIGDIQHVNKLRTLRFGTRFQVEVPWLNLLSNILFLSLKGCKLIKLPESICELSSLRYLDISHSRIQVLPEKFWCLCTLQVFNATRSSLQTIHQDVTKLVNLRRLALPMKCSDKLPKLSGLGNLSSLWYLSYFKVGKENGQRISELKRMNQLTGRLSIRSIENIQSMEEAAEARLVDKQYLKELVLNWRASDCRLRSGVNGVISLRSGENGVLEALRPPSRIECLQVQGFGGDKSPSWLNPENLPTLTTLKVSQCHFLRYLQIPFPSLEQLVLDIVGIEALTSFANGMPAGSTGDDRTQHGSSSIARLPLTRLTTLRLSKCYKLTSLDQFLSPEYLPSIKSIEIYECHSLRYLPIPLPSLEQLVLDIVGIEALISFADGMPAGSTGDDRTQHGSSSIARLPLTRLTTLRLSKCYKLTNLDQFLSLEYLPSIKSIEIYECHSLRYLPIPLPSLEQLVLSDVGIEALTSFADGTPAGSTGDDRTQQHGSSSSSIGIARLPLTQLTTLRLFGCDKLTNLDQFLSPDYLPSIKSIEIECCWSLVSLPVHTFVGFLCLQDLKIHKCYRLVCPREMVLPPSLRRLSIGSCGKLDKSFLGCLENLTSLTLLHLRFCKELTSLDQFLSPDYLPSIKSIEIVCCESLVSLPVHTFVGFLCLQDLKIHSCCKLVCPREMVLPPSLRRLSISICGELDKSFPCCLENLTSLTLLHLVSCGNVESIPLSSIDTSKLKCLLLRNCSELSSIGGLQSLSSIQHVEISGCPKLTEIQQPFEKKGLPTKEEELLKFANSC